MEIDTQHGTIVIATQGKGNYIKPGGITLGGRHIEGLRISHDELVEAKELKLKLY